MPVSPETLRPLLRQALIVAGASTLSWYAGQGRPSGTAVEVFGGSAPIDGMVSGGKISAPA